MSETEEEDFYSCPASQFLVSEEPLSDYKPGGYHPISLGETLRYGRYTVCHKLGWGRSSTVWLVRDNQQEKWVALKILKAGSIELELAYMTEMSKRHHRGPSTDHIVQMLDCFDIRGPNGLHRCMVTELLGPSMENVLSNYTNNGETMLPSHIVLRLCWKVLKAVSFVHHAGYSHGNIHSKNFLFTCSNLTKASEDECVRVIGGPISGDLVAADGKPLREGLPKQLVKTAQWDNWKGISTEGIRLIDFGDSFPSCTTPALVRQPLWRLPEIVFEGRYDWQGDLWHTGYMIYWITFADNFFDHHDGVHFACRLLLFAESLPTQWTRNWEEMRAQPSAKWVDEYELKPTLLNETFRVRQLEPEIKPLLPVVRALMRILPSDRLPIDDVVAALWDESVKANRRASVP